ncbi:hypothetical protein PHACT_12425 [Pseudohongiella acticola]|uniref:DUF418 domain-containing protein n=1 Tax=Pseudohongiella acticola TaxID=1524254 RepID=A0A1E8CGM3_9GAMM|nr:DUF418 domain-containing protein [Pseudohongiella acticola]OFE11357.1 hypothetical protein PHACT_12425 [Pseudohongiella acticola]
MVAPLASPTSDRINSLDVLRGFAVLGILVMNIQIFAMPSATYLNPTVWGTLSGVDGAVWYLSHVFTDQKKMALFSMLFGAGIILFTERATAQGKSAVGYHYRRNFWLLLFGAAHAYLLWYGDVLFLYAICAFALYPLRNWRPRRLIIVGIVFLSISSIVYLLTGFALPSLPEEVLVEAIQPSWNPPAAQLAEEIAAYQGGWSQQMSNRVPVTLEMHTFVYLIWGFWRAAGMMLLGMALYKLGILSARADNRVYWRFLAVGVLLGLPIIMIGIQWNFANAWGPVSMFLGSQFNYWASILVSMAYMASLILLLKHNRMNWLTQRLAAVGRMAFSNYIMHTLICGFIFYGHGLGQFGQIDRSGQIVIVFGIWILQLLVSPMWLRHFRFGPLEWLWRSLTYWRFQPMAR